MHYSIALSLVFAMTALTAPTTVENINSVSADVKTSVSRSLHISEREYKRALRAARVLNKRDRPNNDSEAHYTKSGYGNANTSDKKHDDHNNNGHSSYGKASESKCTEGEESHETPALTPTADNYGSVETAANFGSGDRVTKVHHGNQSTPTTDIYGSNEPNQPNGGSGSGPYGGSDGGSDGTYGGEPTPTASSPASQSTGSSSISGVGNSGGGQFLKEVDIAEKILTMHNTLRARHGVAPLTWSAAASSFSLDTSTTCEHVHTTSEQRAPYKYGENWAWTSDESTDVGDMVLNQWYNNEIVNYDFSTGKSTGGDTGHFTQVVWKDTTQVGCSVKLCSGLFMKCDYYVWGNYNDEYTTQVLPVESGLSLTYKASDSDSSY